MLLDERVDDGAVGSGREVDFVFARDPESAARPQLERDRLGAGQGGQRRRKRRNE